MIGEVMCITSRKVTLCALNFSVSHFSRWLWSFLKAAVASLMLNANGVESRTVAKICFRGEMKKDYGSSSN